MRSDSERGRERESNSIFSFVEETKTRLILSRQMDNSTRGYSPCLSQKIGSVYRGGVENLSIEFDKSIRSRFMRILQRMKQLWYYFIPLYIVRYFRSEGGTVFARVLN